MPDGFVRARGGDPPPGGEALWFIFAGRDALLREDGAGLGVPVAPSLDSLGLRAESTLFIGTLGGAPCMAAFLPEGATGDGFSRRDLRALFGHVPDAQWAVAGLAFQLCYWAETTRFCPRSGDATHLKTGEWAMECPSCGLLQYPRVSPCVIGLIYDGEDGERLLLTRQPGWPAGRYGLVAGFVEPGETLEQCLAREVREETGVEIGHVRYFSSQPWPFPHQLMVGFTARYAGGDVVVDRSELEDAAWFRLDALPALPPPLSIARRIIDAHVAARKGTTA